MNTKKKYCKWCGLDLPKQWQSEKHECPVIFVHKIIQKGKRVEYIIRGENKWITQEWLGESILIRVEGYRPSELDKELEK